MPDGGRRAPDIVLDLGEADGRAELRQILGLGQRRVAEHELGVHAPAGPLEKGRTRHILAAHHPTGQVAEQPDDRRR
jgi:hypothetical protein